MEIISKISKGSKMDQVYIPKKRSNFSIGSYVILKPLDKKRLIEKPYFYNIKHIEPIKIEIINEIISIINDITTNKNIIITGSFLDKGFYFNDIDVILVTDSKLKEKEIKKTLENKLKIKIHIIMLNTNELIKGLKTDPLYQIMLSRCIAKKRFIYKIKPKFYYYKILDLNLLKSNQLTYGFDYLNGNEKYYLTRNMVAILMFIEDKKLTNESVNKEIEKLFNIKIKEIKENIIGDKKEFIKKYKKIYNKTFNKLMKGVKNGSKQK